VEFSAGMADNSCLLSAVRRLTSDFCPSPAWWF
jgi:hypothetical protein